MANDWASLIAEEVEQAERDGDARKEANEANEAHHAEPKAGVSGVSIEELRQRAAKPLKNPYVGLKPCPAGGYEFRAGHSTKFPKIELQAAESELQGAFRAASELRSAGLQRFGDGSSFVAAQEAVDAWGQGLLALHRLRNLSARAVTQDDDEARKVLEGSEAVESVNALEVVLRLNLAQALIKLRQYENAVCQCQGALELDPKNLKALWRKAKAVWALRCPGEAREALDEFLKADPGNPAARQMLLEIETEELKRKAKRVGPSFGPRTAERSSRSAGQKSASEEPTIPPDEDVSIPKLWFCCRRKRKRS